MAPVPFVAPVLYPLESSSEATDLAAVRLVIEAAGGCDEVSWAAGMVVTGGRRQIVVTSDRGRGWMPADALLPEDVVLPWSHESSSRWEGLIDPARVIVEYAHAVDGELSALSSTHSSAPAVAAGVPFAYADPSRRAQPDLWAGRVADRVMLQVEEKFREQAAARTDPREQCETVWGMAWEAARSEPITAVQDHILRQLHTKSSWWDQPRWLAALPWGALLEDYRELEVRERAARVDVRDVAVGDLDTGGGGCQLLLRQLYAVEMLLALRNSPSHALHEGLYPWWMHRDATHRQMVA